MTGSKILASVSMTQQHTGTMQDIRSFFYNKIGTRYTQISTVTVETVSSNITILAHSNMLNTKVQKIKKCHFKFIS